jgi:penicillin-binding protein 1C
MKVVKAKRSGHVPGASPLPLRRPLVAWRRSAAVLAGALVMSNASALPSFAEIQRDFQPSDATLLDRNGELIHAMRLNSRERRLSWIKLDDISPALRNALIASEDKRFYAHGGVDWSAALAAAWGNVVNSKTRGASTITMQLAGLLDQDLRRNSAPRSAAQKIGQVVVAQSLERQWRKDQILEAYLNLVSFRGELVGVHALSRVMFDKHPSGLNQIEAAIAVALIRAPNARPAKVAERACIILKSQHLASECKGLEGVTELALARPAAKIDLAGGSAQQASPQLAPHLAQHLVRELARGAGRPLRTTLDAGVQRFARAALARQLAALTERNIEDGAVLVLDNATGEVLSWVGSSGEFSAAAEVDGVVARRQAGSTLKPFLYEMALEMKWLTAASVLDDAAINLPTAAGLYIPQNYDKHFKGLVSVRTALGSSLNIPAVRTLVAVTPERFFQRLQALGFQLREGGDYYGYSLALGSADVSLLALTNAYRTLANQGRYSPVRTDFRAVAAGASIGPSGPSAASAAKEAAPRAVMDPAAAFIVSDILSDRSARARTFGLESALATRIWTAVKTGTSKDMRDNWCVGYSDRYTVGVWVGNASGLPMWDVSGVTGAAPIWQEVMQFLHSGRVAGRAGQPSRAPVKPPPGVLAQAIRYQGQLEAPRTEYFLAGTEQSEIALSKPDDINPAIRYPTPGMLIALDPDIPPARQRVRFAAQGITKGSWLLDGKPVSDLIQGRGQRLQNKLHNGGAGVPISLALDWSPWPGKHGLALLDGHGVVVDTIQFEVRGAVEKASGQKSQPKKPVRKSNA